MGITAAVGIGAAVGGIGAAVTGGDPLTGALIGGATGGIADWAAPAASSFLAGDAALGAAGAEEISPLLAAADPTLLAAGDATVTAAGAGGFGSGLGTLGAVQIGSSLLGAGSQAYGAQQAANAQTNAANRAIQNQQQMFGVAQQNLQPFINTGSGAASQLASLQGYGPAGANGMMQTLQSLPGYQFTNYQGLKSVQNGATARGLGVSGAAQKGAANYATNLANTYYNNYLSGLQGTATIGANAAGSLAGNAITSGANVGGNYNNIGQAQAAGSLAQAGAIGNAASSVPNALLMNQLLQNNTSNQSMYG